MCLHTRGASQWDVPKARSGGDGKTPAEDIKERKDEERASKEVILLMHYVWWVKLLADEK